MSRHERRGLAAQSRKQLPTKQEVMAALVAAMADRGPTIRRGLVEALGTDEVLPDDLGQATVGAGAIFVKAMQSGNLTTAYDAAVEILWLARALAHAAGKVTETPAAEA
jgi:hypothetical protein